MNEAQSDIKLKPTEIPEKAVLKAFIRSFLVPNVIGKALLLYFGLMYSDHPGDGYGYGLCATIAFTVGNLSLFCWKHRNYED